MTAAANSGAVPVPVTPLIGRERELAAAGVLLRQPEVRLVTLAGAGGAGKTRLALQLARDLDESYSGRVTFVPLAALADPEMVLSAIAAALGLREGDEQPLTAQLDDAVGDQRRLLVLDNFEHLLPAAPAIAALLAATSRVTMLVTSRAVLHLSGEHVLEVPPLALPEPGPLPPLPHLRDIPAVRLFVDRAYAAANAFSFDETSAPAVVEICRRVDGLPLAIELAAARSRLLPPPVLLSRLERRLPLLTGGARDLPDRQQTLRATVAWSHQLLTPPEQALLRRLAVFPGGWTLEAAEAVGGDERSLSILDCLASLVDKSLVTPAGGAGDDARFGMLETVREFALEQLEASGDSETANQRHVEYCITLAERAAPALDGPEQHDWLAKLEREHANLRAAMERACSAGMWDAALRLAGALGRFWEVRGHIREGRRWLDQALAGGAHAPASLRVTALLAAGTLARTAGDYPDARRRLQESLALQLEIEDRAGAARTWFEIAQVAHFLGDFEDLFAACERSLSLYRELGDRHGVAVAVGMEGHAAWHLRDYRRARTSLEESIAVWRELGDDLSVSWGQWDLGNIARDEGDPGAAHQHYVEGIHGARQAGDMQLVAPLLDGFGSLALHDERPAHAARLMGAAEAVRETHGITLPPSYVRDVHNPLLIALQNCLSADELTAALEGGRALTAEQAIDEALTGGAGGRPSQEPGVIAAATAKERPPDGLSARELEVLRLIAAGKSNREIADALVLSLNTVYRHVSSIFDKTGATNRTEAALYAHRHGLAE
jgi:non-specific serine/threonine protein kinase